MIKQISIEEIKQKADLTEMVGRYTTVKRDAACCPFHNEKTPSFRIWKAKQTYKCFGCGKSGDVFSLIQEKEGKTFYEAVEYLANILNITLETDQQSAGEAQEIKDQRTEQLAVVQFANKKYQEVLQALPDDSEVIQYLVSRGYSRQRMKAWDMGFAPDDWKFITTPLINAGKFQPAVDAGIVYTKDGKNWDFYRNRITMPIHDQNGIVIGLAGRIIGSDKTQAKYFNPKESLVYNKKKVFYGLWQAAKAIREEGFAYLVEGYLDVHAMQDNGMLNTLSPCGTEVDETQVKFLKRYTDHVVVSFDPDKPGTTKQLKVIDIFLKHDFKVHVLNLPNGKDPDEYIKDLCVGDMQVIGLEKVA